MSKQLLNYMGIAVLSISLLTATSCKKKNDSPPSVSSQVEGQWEIAYEGTDQNGNGTLEQDERDYNLSGEHTYMIFKAGGSAVYKMVDDYDASYNFDANFTWSLQNNDKEIILDSLGDIYTSPTKINGRIKSLTDKELIIEYDEKDYNNETYLAWYVLNKQ